MLPKAKRITGTRDFKRVYQKGSFFSANGFSVNWARNRSANSRLGVVVTKKTEPKATGRNLLKRRYREAAQKLYSQIPNNLDVIITIKPNSKKMTFSDIVKEMEFMMKRLGNNEKNINKRY